VITADEKRVIAYHEAGHALVAGLLPSVPTTHKISIIPRGESLGYTLNIPEEDRYLLSKPELLDHLKVLLGGYVAEQIVFECTTTGAAGDLKRVVEVSRAMIEDYGMGTQLFLASGSGGEALTSEATLHRRDEEQQGLVDEAQFEARMLIMDNRALLDRLAEALLSKESLERKEIAAIMAEMAEEPDEPNKPDEPNEPDEPDESEPVIEPEVSAEPPETDGGASNGSVRPPAPKGSIPPPAHQEAETATSK
jgi:cell division protease FtsH